MLDTLTLETFTPRIGDSFRLSAAEGQSLALTLLEATALGGGAPRATTTTRTPFSLIFLGPPQPVWMQRIYRIEHGAMGSFDLFLVPIGLRDGGMQYEAIFT